MRLCAAPRLSARSRNRRSGPRGACESREGKGGGLAGSRRPPAAHSAAAAILCLIRRRRHKMPPARGRRFFTARGALGAGRAAAAITTPPRDAAPITALALRPALQKRAVIGLSAGVRMRTAPLRQSGRKRAGKADVPSLALKGAGAAVGGGRLGVSLRRPRSHTAPGPEAPGGPRQGQGIGQPTLRYHPTYGAVCSSQSPGPSLCLR